MSTSRKRRSSGKEEAEGSSREEKGAEGGRGGGRRILRARTTVYYDDEGEGDIKAGSDSTYNPSSDGESEENEEESDPTSVGKKYHTAAANAVDNALKKVLLKCNCSARIVDLCDIGNESIINETAGLFKSHKEMKKGIAFPTCVSVNRNICHFSPLSSDTSTLEDKDIVKIEMAAHVNGYVAIVAHTIEIRKDDDAVRGRAADVIAAANAVAELLTQQIRPRILMKNIFGDLEHIVNEYDCKFIRMNIYEPKRFLIGCEEHDICFQEDRVYVIDIITSTGEGKPEELDQSHTTVFEVDENAKDELEGEYLVAFNKIHEKFHVMPFTTRGLETDLDVESMQKYHEMLKPYPVLYAKEGELTAHVKFTVLLKTDKLVKITPSPKYQKLLPLRSFDEPLLGMDENSAASKNDKGKGLELVYCGMLPVGEEGLGPAPIIESISWNTTLKEEHGDEGLAFLCSGSFGTYCYSRSLSVENNDIQCGWEKKLILIAPAKRCSWNPKFRDIIAIGTVPDLGTGQIFKRGHVHIMNLNASKEITFDKPNYEGWSSLGVNSLCWSRSGAHLLFAGDHTDSVGIITMKEKNKSIKCWVAQVHYRVYKLDKGHKADVVGAFHPFMDQFAMATSSGIINVIKTKS